VRPWVLARETRRATGVPMSAIPQHLPASGTDVAVSITRAVTRQRIGIRLVFAGRLDEARLERAVRLTLDAEPILGCSFEVARRASWRRIDDLDAAVPFTVSETADPENDMIRFQVEEVPDAGPQVAVLLSRTPGHDEIGIKLSHVPVDGQGAKRYAYLLAETYRALSDADYAPVPNIAPRPTAADVWTNLSPAQRKTAKRAKSWAVPNWPVPAAGTSGGDLTYRALSVPPERFLALKTYGRQRGATVNAIMLAAYFRALVRALDPPRGTPLSLMSTADHRRYLPDADSCPIGMLSISGPLGIERVDAEPFDGTLGRVVAAMAVWEEQCYGAGPAYDAEKLNRFSYKTVTRILGTSFRLSPKGKTYPYFTNIGILDEARLAFGEEAPVAGSMYGPASFGASPVATVSTYRDALTVCMGCTAADAAITATDEILALLDDEIARCLEASA
jgi:NRPS condensation-like uncharacterized protein